MIRAFKLTAAVTALVAFAVACSTTPETVTTPPPTGIYKVGNPYQIEGTWYYPKEQPDYDETGVASWYGQSFAGRYTANGESFDIEGLTAAHRTLPMPVNVRVTNLENGRSIILRVNDRGPFAKGRIIDVSTRAAKLLGFYEVGTARVRVTFASRANLGNGQPAPSDTPVEIASAVPAAPAGKVDVGTLSDVSGARVAAPAPMKSLPTASRSMATTPDELAATQPTGVVSSVPVPPVTHLYVQVGAFSIYSDARRIQGHLGPGLKISAIERNRQRLYRVRLGPFDQVADADQALAQVTRLGSNDARIIVDQ
jgi:rare lipoprotein A